MFKRKLFFLFKNTVWGILGRGGDTVYSWWLVEKPLPGVLGDKSHISKIHKQKLNHLVFSPV